MVEGARLESVYTPKRRIEGSNPSLSATHRRGGALEQIAHHSIRPAVTVSPLEKLLLSAEKAVYASRLNFQHKFIEELT